MEKLHFMDKCFSAVDKVVAKSWSLFAPIWNKDRGECYFWEWIAFLWKVKKQLFYNLAYFFEYLHFFKRLKGEKRPSQINIIPE
jgi:hypothetical protein